MQVIFLLFFSVLSITLCKSQDKQKIETLLEFVKVEGANFRMGNVEFEDTKLHEVEISSFYIQKTEVTQELWVAVMGYNPSKNKTWKEFPVTDVSWDNCQDFIKKLNSITGRNFRLPTESEWEYAARGGKQSKGFKYAGSDNINEVAWHYYNSNNRVHSVKKKMPNELGLYDMSGNVYEWCQDLYAEYNIDNHINNNKNASTSDEFYVMRGGSWYSTTESCQVAYRQQRRQSSGNNLRGFRLVTSEL
jgi:formylglycine-generating enzyme required for sulfatase activity